MYFTLAKIGLPVNKYNVVTWLRMSLLYVIVKNVIIIGCKTWLHGHLVFGSDGYNLYNFMCHYAQKKINCSQIITKFGNSFCPLNHLLLNNFIKALDKHKWEECCYGKWFPAELQEQ